MFRPEKVMPELPLCEMPLDEDDDEVAAGVDSLVLVGQISLLTSAANFRGSRGRATGVAGKMIVDDAGCGIGNQGGKGDFVDSALLVFGRGGVFVVIF